MVIGYILPLHGTNLLDGFENRLAQVLGARFLGIDSSDNFCAIIDGLLTMKRSLFTGKPLAYYFGIRVYFQIFSSFCVVEPHLSAK